MSEPMNEPSFAPRAAMHWREYQHAEDRPCPDPERLRFTARQFVETPDDAADWPGVECGGCGQPLEPVT